MRAKTTVAVLCAVLCCSVNAGKFESAPEGPDTAEVEVNLYQKSARNLVLVGAFKEGVQCQDLQIIGAFPGKIPTYVMRVEAKPLSLIVASAGEGQFSYGEVRGRRCGGTYTFEPRRGARYVFDFTDEPEQCVVRLLETTSAGQMNRSEEIVKRDAIERAPGRSRCADEYVPKRPSVAQ